MKKRSGFKMRSGNKPSSFKAIGSSPVKGKFDDFKKSVQKTASKVYDKASQIGMGLKQMGSELSGNRSDFPSAGYGTKQPVRAFNEGYQKEKKYDEGAERYKSGPKAPKTKAPTVEQNMKNVQLIKSRKTAIDKLNKKNPKLKLKY